MADVERSTYKLLTGSHGRMENGSNVIYRKGDSIDLTEREARALGSRVRKVDNSGAEGGEVATDWSSVASQNVGEVIAIINALDSLEDVEAIRAVESSAQRRKSILTAAETKLRKLRAEEGGG